MGEAIDKAWRLLKGKFDLMPMEAANELLAFSDDPTIIRWHNDKYGLDLSEKGLSQDEMDELHSHIIDSDTAFDPLVPGGISHAENVEQYEQESGKQARPMGLNIQLGDVPIIDPTKPETWKDGPGTTWVGGKPTVSPQITQQPFPYDFDYIHQGEPMDLSWRLLKLSTSFRGSIMEHLPTELNYSQLQEHLENNPDSTLGDLVIPYLTGQLTNPTSEVEYNPPSYQGGVLPYPLSQEHSENFMNTFQDEGGNYSIPDSYYGKRRDKQDIHNQKLLSNVMRTLHGRIRQANEGFEMNAPRTEGTYVDAERGRELPKGRMARHNMRLQDYMNTPVKIREAQMTPPISEESEMIHASEPMNIAWRLLKEEEKDYDPYSENEEDLMSAPWDLMMAIQEQAYALAEQNTPWDKEKYPTWHDWQEAIEVEGEVNLAHMMMSPEYGYLREWYHQLGKAPDSYGWATQEDMGMKERDDYLDYHKDMGIPLPGESFAIDIPGIDEPMEIENHPQGHKENPFKPTMYEKDGKPTWPLGVVYNEETGFTRSEPMNIAMRLLKRETHPGYPKNMTIQDLINAGFDFPFNTEKYPDEDITEEEHIAEYGEAPFNPYEPIFADEADEPLNFKLDAKDIHNYRKRMYENTLNAMNERSPDFANAQWAKWIAGDALPPAPPDSPLRMRRQVLIPSEEGDVATIDAMLDEPDYTGATMAQSFKDIPFNEETGFTRSEPMDLAMRLLKDISQGYSSVILNEPEQMLSMVDELGIRDHLPPDFTHEEGRFPHHMTLNMGHLPEGWEHGQPVDLTIDGWGIVNEPKAQAMAFRVNRESLPAPIDEDRTPHISTMVGPNGKPVHSNQIVEWNDIEPFNVKGLVSGRSGNE